MSQPTKLEELARRIENPKLSRMGIERELETALKPLLDELESARSTLDMEGFDESAECLREQLSQWRKK